MLALLLLPVLGACNGSAEAPLALATDQGDPTDVLAQRNDDAPPKPAFAGMLDGEPYLAEAEQACIVERDPISGARRFVLSFERAPDDALILHIPEAGADGDPQIATAYLLQGERYLEARAPELDDWTLADQGDGWLLAGEFELDLFAPVSTVASSELVAATGIEESESQTSGAPTAAQSAVSSHSFRDGSFQNLYCLDLDRLKSLGGGPKPANPVN
ncbi:hypothetical protein C7S18_03635 [Ahniella affigens]|uniref:Lipoprotein n=1 Tax=Ahniella affigens TaxID=2021234 RepID=A0A2P1PNE5_9GAMM|nr:hypothetical protein C7S18_03635 [Ahniella affigens]